MNNNEVVIYEQPKVEIKPYRNDYNINIGNFTTKLQRDVDFGMILKKDGTPITQRPTLYKSGAEKLLLGFGLPYDIEISDSYKDHENGYFYYEVKAIAKDKNGNIVRVGVGCANSKEKSNGFAGGFDVANSMLKKAKKRAIVDLALSLASCSDLFVQDIEDTTNETKAKELLKDDDAITPKQTKRIFAIAANNEITQEKAKSLLAEWGFTSTKEIKQKDYDKICEKLENNNKGDN